MTNKTLVVIAGPTGVGKTTLGITIAEKFKTGIVSADARQFYRGLPIGTAAPSKQELDRVPHHLVGHLSVHDYYNVAMYEKEALGIINRLFLTSDHVVVVGGSGLYIDTLCRGIDLLPDPDPLVRKQVQQVYDQQGIRGLRQWIRKVDPEFAGEVDQANPQRMKRALEVFLVTGTPFSSLRKQQAKKRPFRIRKLILNRSRQDLFDRINKRTQQMIERGLVEEALAFYRYRHLNALNTVGYKEVFSWLSNTWTLHTAIEKIKTNTRRYAKRQLTWFRRYDDAAWFHPDETDRIERWIAGNDAASIS